MKKILVCGSGGFIGSHLVTSLKKQGHYVIGADLKFPEFNITNADEFYITDLRDQLNVKNLVTKDIDEVYQLAADMGGIGYIGTGDKDASIMHNSAKINLNILDTCNNLSIKKIFFSSSACIYNKNNQMSIENPDCCEDSAYPAFPDSEYGWEKLFSERLYIAYNKQYGMCNRIARFHNIFGEEGTWQGGKEKAPAAICRKIALAKKEDEIEIWGSGNQTRSFLYIDECVEGIHKIMASDYEYPLNLGSERIISINNLVLLIAKIAGKTIRIKNIEGPVGVAGRNSNNKLISETINWFPKEDLEYGLSQTYKWIENQINKIK